MQSNPIRAAFPFFEQANAPIYLDSAATALKPQAVIDRIAHFYAMESANIHRGGYPLAARATDAYEAARAAVAAFVGAKPEQVVFTLNATDALNQAAAIVAKARIRRGTNVIATALEHHSALLPMMRACREAEAELRFVPIGEDGTPDLSALDTLVDGQTAAAVLTAGANSTGWRAPLDAMLARFSGVPVVLDATQRVVHERLDFSTLGCDFLCFSGHKLYGPTGIGVLVMREEWMREGGVRVGGGMVSDVTQDGYAVRAGAEGFEAGTPPIAQAIGLHAAIDFLTKADSESCFAREAALTQRLLAGLEAIPGMRVIPAGEDRLPLLSFVGDALHPADMAQLLGARGFALRSGRHCAHIAHSLLGEESTLRASLGVYSNEADVDALLNAVDMLQMKWRKRRG